MTVKQKAISEKNGAPADRSRDFSRMTWAQVRAAGLTREYDRWCVEKNPGARWAVQGPGDAWLLAPDNFSPLSAWNRFFDDFQAVQDRFVEIGWRPVVLQPAKNAAAAPRAIEGQVAA